MKALLPLPREEQSHSSALERKMPDLKFPKRGRNTAGVLVLLFAGIRRAKGIY